MRGTETAIVTGAGSGIGREFTRLFLEDGSRVLAVSLLESELDSLALEFSSHGDRLLTLTMDLSRHEAALELERHCDEQGLDIDILVNNAGFACFGDLCDLDLDRVTTMIELNAVSLSRMCLIFSKKMKHRGGGSILNVGSTAGMLPAARLSAYAGSKAYVNAFSFALREELAPYGINVTCLTPAAVASKFADSADIMSFQGKSMLKDTFKAGKASLPEDVARAGYDGLRRGKAQVLTGKKAWMVGILARLVPARHLPRLMRNV